MLFKNREELASHKFTNYAMIHGLIMVITAVVGLSLMVQGEFSISVDSIKKAGFAVGIISMTLTVPVLLIEVENLCAKRVLLPSIPGTMVFFGLAFIETGINAMITVAFAVLVLWLVPALLALAFNAIRYRNVTYIS